MKFYTNDCPQALVVQSFFNNKETKNKLFEPIKSEAMPVSVPQLAHNNRLVFTSMYLFIISTLRFSGRVYSDRIPAWFKASPINCFSVNI